MIGRGYESRDLAAGSSRNASPTNHPDHPLPPPSAGSLHPRPCILRLCLRHPPPACRPSTPRNTTLASRLSYPGTPLFTFHPPFVHRSSSPCPPRRPTIQPPTLLPLARVASPQSSFACRRRYHHHHHVLSLSLSVLSTAQTRREY